MTWPLYHSYRICLLHALHVDPPRGTLPVGPGGTNRHRGRRLNPIHGFQALLFSEVKRDEIKAFWLWKFQFGYDIPYVEPNTFQVGLLVTFPSEHYTSSVVSGAFLGDRYERWDQRHFAPKVPRVTEAF